MTAQPNALAAITAAITAALTAKQQPAVAAPAQTAFAFTPQPAPFANVQQVVPFGGPGAVTPNPFQPTPVQAQAAFVAAVPQDAQQHAHPTTGVPFAPINPPGEATSAPTVGLDALPVQDVQTAVGPEAIDAVLAANPPPKARTRKPRAQSTETVMVAGVPLTAGDGAVQPAAASAAHSRTAGDEGGIYLECATWKELMAALKAQGVEVYITARSE